MKYRIIATSRFEKDVKRIVTDEQREKLLAFLRAGRRAGADAAGRHLLRPSGHGPRFRGAGREVGQGLGRRPAPL